MQAEGMGLAAALYFQPFARFSASGRHPAIAATVTA